METNISFAKSKPKLSRDYLGKPLKKSCFINNTLYRPMIETIGAMFCDLSSDRST